MANLNFHLDDNLNVPANKFKALLESLNLIQHVSGPTHRDGHSLDVIITHEDLKISDITTPHTISPDHFTILFSVDIPRPVALRKEIQFRKFKGIDMDKFKSDLEVQLVPLNASENETNHLFLDRVVDHYHTTTLSIFD